MDYKKVHDKIIERAKARTLPLDQYREKHHIVPRCMGGTDELDNLVELTAREHYVVHQLLVKMYPNESGLVWAARYMTYDSNGERINNRLYEWLKTKYSKVVSKQNKEKWKDSEYKERMVMGIKKKWQDEEYREKMSKMHSEYNKEKWKDPEYRKKMLEASKDYWADPENRKQASKRVSGKKNGCYGTHWYHHPDTLHNIKCKSDEIPDGYIKGRKLKPHNKCKMCSNDILTRKSSQAKYCSDVCYKDMRAKTKNTVGTTNKEKIKKKYQEWYDLYLENTFVDFCRITGYDKCHAALCMALKTHIDDYQTKQSVLRKKK